MLRKLRSNVAEQGADVTTLRRNVAEEVADVAKLRKNVEQVAVVPE
jgi:hypothetical protein